jgi:hypothetical protein
MSGIAFAGRYEGSGVWYDEAGKPLGNGYCFEDYCRYHIAAGQAVVEVTLRASGNALEVYGSSTKNAEGLYIAWRESLRRTA